MSSAIHGACGFSLLDHYESPINALPGDPASFTIGWLGRITSQLVPSLSRRIFSQRIGNNPGWDLYTGTTNASMVFACGGTSAANSPTMTIAAGDVGKILYAVGVWDGVNGKIRGYLKRAEVASGTTLTGGFIADTAAKAYIGRKDGISSVAFPADGVCCFGVTYAVGLPSLAQIQAAHDHIMATERIQHIPGLPGVLIDLDQDIVANGGSLPATLTNRGSGSVTFSKVGSPALCAHYGRSWAW